MLANERQDVIKRLLQENGAVKTSKLVEKFNVSLETVRRDFIVMEKAGLLKKVHGGAVAVGEMRHFNALEQRREECYEQKKELSQVACKYIREGDIIGIDSGATAAVFAKVLKEKFKKLTVVTYSMEVFSTLSNHAEFSVILCGGNFDRSENSFYGSLALETLDKLQIQKAFIFPYTISLKFGIGDFSDHLMLMQKRLISNSNEIYILADSSKFEKKALLKLDDLKKDYTYVTDGCFSNDLKELYIENEFNVVNQV